jgi:hypothetical protein
LCPIPNPIAALIEMRRVLKPSGQLLFVEHGLSQESRVALWQHRLTPCWKRIGGGCHLDRKMDDLIRAAGFEIDAVETGYMRAKALDIHVSGFGDELILPTSVVVPSLLDDTLFLFIVDASASMDL